MDERSTAIPAGTVIDLTSSVIGVRRDGGVARLMDSAEGGPPLRLDGHTIGAPMLTGDAPHAGERHPDGDEVLLMVSGRVEVRLELDGGEQTVRLGPGQALVVPKGIWHLVHMIEPGQLVHITPGPHGEHRPLSAG